MHWNNILAISTQHSLFIVSTIALFILSACSTGNEQLTLVAQNEVANTEISNIRSTATVSRARLQTTLDYASTRVVDIEQQGLFMRATLVALGTDSVFLNSNLPLSGNFPTFTPQPTSPINVAISPAPQPLVTEDVNVDGTRVQITLEATEASNQQPRMENIVLASGVNDNDCARDTNPRLTPNSTEIYVVATAYNIPAGANITSTWQSNGTEVAFFSFQTETIIDGSCIWFFIDQTDAEFVPGIWSVELRINDVSASQPLPFQISES